MKKFIFGFILVSSALFAKHPYQARLIVDHEQATVSAPNLVDLSRELKTQGIKELLPLYTPTSFLELDINIRGIIADAAFPAGSTELVVFIPQTNTTTTFYGGTRDESILLLKDYIRDGGTHHNLLKAYSKYSPIDPIAGNPNCLMAMMGQADYMMGHLNPLSGCDRCWTAQPLQREYQFGGIYGRAFSHEFDTTTFTAPSRYSYSPDLNWALIVDAPVTYNNNGGASSVFGSLAVGVRIPIIHEWSVTPILRGGAGGSLDLCTGGTFVSTGLTSVVNLKITDFVFSLTNYAGYITTTNLWLSGVNFNYNLNNYIFKNGISINSCHLLEFCNRTIDFSISFVDSTFAKDRLYINHYDEVGVSVIVSHLNPYSSYDNLSLGFSYQFGEKSYKGYYVNLIYQF